MVEKFQNLLMQVLLGRLATQEHQQASDQQEQGDGNQRSIDSCIGERGGASLTRGGAVGVCCCGY